MFQRVFQSNPSAYYWQILKCNFAKFALNSGFSLDENHLVAMISPTRNTDSYSSIRLLELIISDSCFLPTVIYYLETPPILTNIYIIFTFIFVLAVEIDKENNPKKF